MLAPILVVAGVVLLVAGNGSSFSGDDFSYYGRQVVFDDLTLRHFDSLTPEYLLIPHNGHLQVGGKLVYEILFSLFRADYTAFRVVAVVAVLVCVALFFELARRRIGDEAALVLTILLAFFGAAWEVMLWPFDLHTTIALAAGLGALLVLERERAHADAVACLLLVLAICFIELGLVFTAAVAVSVLMRADRWRRAWIFLVPLALFAIWYVWARQYHFPGPNMDLGGLVPSVLHSLGAVLSSLTGTLPTGAEVPVSVVGQSVSGTAMALAAVLLLAVRLTRGKLPRTLWPLLAALVTYWVLIAFAVRPFDPRPPDSSRYMLVGATLVLLVAADCVRGWRPGPRGLAALALVVAVALPANIAKRGDGSRFLSDDAALTGGELAMLELAGTRGDPGYLTVADPVVIAHGTSPYLEMSTGQYLDAAKSRGSIAVSLDQVRQANIFLRAVDDVVLADALGLGLTTSGAPARGAAGCLGTGASPGAVDVPDGGVLVQARGPEPVGLGLSRFATEQPSKDLGAVDAGQWARLALPPADTAPEPWRLFFDGRVRICPLA